MLALRAWVLIFVLLAAVVPAGAFTLSAPSATIKTNGGNSTGGWGLYSNGDLGDYFNITAGTYTVTVKAFGRSMLGIWPEMTMNIDGRTVGWVSVSSYTWAIYTFQLPVGVTGPHCLTVSFINDDINSTEDRNLYLYEIVITPPAGVAEPTLTDRASWAAAETQRESDFVAGTAARIETIRKGNGTITVLNAAGRPMANATVVVDQVQHEFLFGGMLGKFDKCSTTEQNTQFKNRFSALFNYATLPFYWRGYEPVQGQPNYPYTDTLVAWCQQYGIRMKGHPLLWDRIDGVPVWCTAQPTPDLQQQRVNDIMTRYAGKIEFWEVVNEPAHLPGIAIDQPYRWARSADPTAKLLVNDFYVLDHGYPDFVQLLQAAKNNGVPYDGIGIQAHDPQYKRFPLAAVDDILTLYSALGKDLYITEFEPQSSGNAIAGSHLTGVWDEAAQADYAENFYRTCFANAGVKGITWWDITDQGAWRTKAGLLRDDATLSPKPAYNALLHLIKQEWHTSAQGKADASGRLTFRGFFGKYTVTVNGQNMGAYMLRSGSTDQDLATVTMPNCVEGVYVFYNNSTFDGNNLAANAGDDAAIAMDKTPLLPGGTAGLANYSNYDKGINGVMIDITRLEGTPTAGDFAFKTGNSNTPANWNSKPCGAITVRPGAGANGSDRIEIVWPDGAIRRCWLQITVKAGGNTGLSSDAVFYYGSAPGETGNMPGSARVDAADVTAARQNPHKTAVNPAGISDRCDFNRDGRVNTVDESIARSNATTVINELKLITAP